MLNLDKKLDQIEHESFKNLIIKRSKGKPLAYLTGVKSFWNYDFRVNEKVLIPRPDSELIVEQVLKIYKYKKDKFFRDWSWLWLFDFVNFKRKKVIFRYRYRY